ncbi:hypothetical protein FAI40_04230 [Acetobacteraceae bacterium]|nr:hypothetical protein FAI40_04230 [Acetobacteraceae bacterium]
MKLSAFSASLSQRIFLGTFGLFLPMTPALAVVSEPAPPPERAMDDLRPLFEPIEPTHIPTYMVPVKPEKKKSPPLPYSGLHKGPQTILMCLDSGLACFKPETVEEWQMLWLGSNGEATLWESPWGRNYLIPKGFNHRDDWVNEWQAASDNCIFEERCDFPEFVRKARKAHKDELTRLKVDHLPSLYRPFFQPKFLTLKSKGKMQYQCDRVTLACTPFTIKEDGHLEGIYRPFLQLMYVTPLPEKVTPKAVAQKQRQKPKQDVEANTGYMGSEADETGEVKSAPPPALPKRQVIDPKSESPLPKNAKKPSQKASAPKSAPEKAK